MAAAVGLQQWEEWRRSECEAVVKTTVDQFRSTTGVADAWLEMIDRFIWPQKTGDLTVFPNREWISRIGCCAHPWTAPDFLGGLASSMARILVGVPPPSPDVPDAVGDWADTQRFVLEQRVAAVARLICWRLTRAFDMIFSGFERTVLVPSIKRALHELLPVMPLCAIVASYTYDHERTKTLRERAWILLLPTDAVRKPSGPDTLQLSVWENNGEDCERRRKKIQKLFAPANAHHGQSENIQPANAPCQSENGEEQAQPSDDRGLLGDTMDLGERIERICSKLEPLALRLSSVPLAPPFLGASRLGVVDTGRKLVLSATYNRYTELLSWRAAETANANANDGMSDADRLAQNLAQDTGPGAFWDTLVELGAFNRFEVMQEARFPKALRPWFVRFHSLF